MQSFASPAEMLDAHAAMFGTAGRQAAEIVIDWAARLFAVPIDPLQVRVILAPVEIGPYNRHAGYCASVGAAAAFILGNRHHCAFHHGDVVLAAPQRFTDFIIHELTHARQRQLMQQHGWNSTKRPGAGAHRDQGWYAAIAEACPNYLGVELPERLWPTGSRTRRGTLTEVEMCHWPRSIRALIEAKDPRLGAVMRAHSPDTATGARLGSVA